MSPEQVDLYKSRMAAVWDHQNLFRVAFDDSIRNGLTEDDAMALQTLGLPCWAAPNICLHPPVRQPDSCICIGEDSDDREILYSDIDGSVFVHDNAIGRLPVAHGIFGLLNLLLDLAELIEVGLVRYGSDAYTHGKIPPAFIADFWQNVELQLGADQAEKSIWRIAVNRMSRGCI